MPNRRFTRFEIEHDRAIMNSFITRYGKDAVLEAVDEIKRMREAKAELDRIDRKYGKD